MMITSDMSKNNMQMINQIYDKRIEDEEIHESSRRVISKKLKRERENGNQSGAGTA